MFSESGGGLDNACRVRVGLPPGAGRTNRFAIPVRTSLTGDSPPHRLVVGGVVDVLIRRIRVRAAVMGGDEARAVDTDDVPRDRVVLTAPRTIPRDFAVAGLNRSPRGPLLRLTARALPPIVLRLEVMLNLQPNRRTPLYQMDGAALRDAVEHDADGPMAGVDLSVFPRPDDELPRPCAEHNHVGILFHDSSSSIGQKIREPALRDLVIR